MKYLIVSDIHGSAPRLAKVLEHYRNGGYDLLLILGDILNYGPRNGLPEGLDAPAVANMLNPLANRIVAVRGNCDSEVDQMLLHFPMMSTSAFLIDSGRRILLTHGHVMTPENTPTGSYDLFISGHTHLMDLDRRPGGAIGCNSGSFTFPKGGNPPSFLTLEDGILSLRDLDGKVLKQLAL